MKTESKHTDHVIAFLNRDMTDNGTLEKARAEYRELRQERDELLLALQFCADVMARVFPNGLPVQQGTFCEERDWAISLINAAAVLSSVESNVHARADKGEA